MFGPEHLLLNIVGKKYQFNKYRPIMFEYVLIENINDTQEDAKKLAYLLKNSSYKINIIPYNATDGIYKRSKRVDSFVKKSLRVLPRLNEEINEEWISDKSRFAIDGLARQRIDLPYIKDNNKLVETDWSIALKKNYYGNK